MSAATAAAVATTNEVLKLAEEVPDTPTAFDYNFLTDAKSYTSLYCMDGIMDLVKKHQREAYEYKLPKYVNNKWKWPVECQLICQAAQHWKTLFNRLGDTKTSNKWTSMSNTVMFIPLSISCDGDEKTIKGNHWVALVIDSYRDPPAMVYWDPMGKKMVYPTLRKQLIHTFQFHTWIELRETLQMDGYQCGIWTPFFFDMYILSLVSQHPLTSIVHCIRSLTGDTSVKNIANYKECTKEHSSAVAAADKFIKDRREIYQKHLARLLLSAAA